MCRTKQMLLVATILLALGMFSTEAYASFGENKSIGGTPFIQDGFGDNNSIVANYTEVGFTGWVWEDYFIQRYTGNNGYIYHNNASTLVSPVPSGDSGQYTMRVILKPRYTASYSGFLIRWVDANNYLYMTLGDTTKLVSVVGGSEETISVNASANYWLPSAYSPNNLTAVMTNNTITVWANSTRIFTNQPVNSSVFFTNSWRFGLWVHATNWVQASDLYLGNKSLSFGPAVSNVSIEGGTAYPGGKIVTYANVSVGADPVDDVWVQHNFTDTLAVYTATNVSTLYTNIFPMNASAGTYVYRMCANDTTGTTTCSAYNTFTISAAASGISLNSSAGWTIDDYIYTSVACSNTFGLGMTLTRNAVGVSNPNAGTFSVGTHAYLCALSDGRNYTPLTATNVLTVAKAGAGCTSANTYAYKTTISESGTQVVLNFTDVVNSYIVHSSLDDIILDTSNVSMTKNLTGGYFIMFNSENVSSFSIRFGNYYINNSLSLAARTNTTMIPFTYSENSSYIYTVFVGNEMTLASGLMPNATNSLVLFCNGGSTRFNITVPSFTVAVNQLLSQMEQQVKYSSTQIYYRDLLVSSGIETKSFYMVDANNYQAVQILFQLQDNTVAFTNAKLHIKKYIGNQLRTITEAPFDVEKKAIGYLTNGEQYQLVVTSGTQSRTVGNLQADNINLIKTISISPILTTNTSLGNTSFSLFFNNATSTITFAYNDYSAQTSLIEMYVYNYTNSSQLLFYGSSTNATSSEINYIVPDWSQSYNTTIVVHHAIYGLNSFTLMTILSGIAALPIALLPGISAEVFMFISGMFIVTIPMFFTEVHGGTAAIFAGIIALILYIFGWYPVSAGLIIVAIALAVISKITEKKVES